MPSPFSIAHGLDFSVGFAGTVMPAPPDYFPALYQDGSHHWIG
jgi:hypothetical protein